MFQKSWGKSREKSTQNKKNTEFRISLCFRNPGENPGKNPRKIKKIPSSEYPYVSQNPGENPGKNPCKNQKKIHAQNPQEAVYEEMSN